MQQFIKHFRREAVGVWVCVEAATRFTLGTTFMNVELTAMLEAEYQRSHSGPM